MDILEVINVGDSKWNKIVESFFQYDVYYLNNYVKAFQMHGDGEPLLVYYESNNIKGINVVMKRDISTNPHFANRIVKNNWYDLISPYGYGGWIIESKNDKCNILDKQLLFKTYNKWCSDNNIVSEFVRFHPVLENHTQLTEFYNVIPLGGTIALELSSPEKIWENLTSKNRNKIRKAKKYSIKIYNGRFPDIFHKFREIYNATMDKDNAKEYYYFDTLFYDSVLEDLAQNAQIFYAELSGEIIAASIILAANGRLNYHLSGSVRDYQNLAPTNLLLYEAALWGCANGCKTFHLGGGVGSKEDSLYEFKKSFYRGEPCRFHVGSKIFMKEKYDELVELRDDLEDKDKFFPRYRG